MTRFERWWPRPPTCTSCGHAWRACVHGGAAGRRNRSAYWRSNLMRQGGSRVRRVDPAVRVRVTDRGRRDPRGNDRRRCVMKARARALPRFAAVGPVVVVPFRIRGGRVMVVSCPTRMFRAGRRFVGLRLGMRGGGRRRRRRVHMRGSGCITRAIQDQAEAQQQAQQHGTRPHAMTIANGPQPLAHLRQRNPIAAEA